LSITLATKGVIGGFTGGTGGVPGVDISGGDSVTMEPRRPWVTVVSLIQKDKLASLNVREVRGENGP
jgi:hypothetical protein